MSKKLDSKTQSDAAACSASLTPGPWRYQKETTHTVLGPQAPPRVRYQIYKDGGVYGHPATCNREEDARAISMLPEIIEALKPFAHYACNPEEGPCHCHNCRARFVLAEALGPNWQNAIGEATPPEPRKIYVTKSNARIAATRS